MRSCPVRARAGGHFANVASTHREKSRFDTRLSIAGLLFARSQRRHEILPSPVKLWIATEQILIVEAKPTTRDQVVRDSRPLEHLVMQRAQAWAVA